MKKVATTFLQNDQPPRPKVEDYENKTKELKAMYEYQQMAESLNNPPSLRELQMKREQEIEEEKRKAEERARLVEEERLRRIEEERLAAAKAAEEERQRRLELEKEVAQQKEQSLREQIQHLTEQIQRYAQNGSGSKSIVDQIRELKETAAELGLLNPSAGKDANIEIELAKLNYQQAREEREFKARMRAEEKKWQLELMRFQEEKEFKKKQLEHDARRLEMLSSIPDKIGEGLAAFISTRAEMDTDKPAARTANTNIQFFKCTDCGTDIPVPPGAKKIKCPKCGSEYEE